ncbi:hypothetical protein LINGRAHAP2_LOCUS15651 [Linum grandiflorum]
MRVLACNINQSPLLCICKSKSDHGVCSRHQLPCSTSTQPKQDSKQVAEKDDKKKKQKKKKKVQWMDLVGKPLFEIREFELTSSETEEREWNVEMNTRSCCACVIL